MTGSEWAEVEDLRIRVRVLEAQVESLQLSAPRGIELIELRPATDEDVRRLERRIARLEDAGQ